MLCKESDNSQKNKEENSEQRFSEKMLSVNRNVDHKSKDSDGCVRIIFGKIIKNPTAWHITQTIHIIIAHTVG